MHILFLSDLHITSWNNWNGAKLQDRLYNTLKYGHLELWNKKEITLILWGDLHTAFTLEKVQQEILDYNINWTLTDVYKFVTYHLKKCLDKYIIEHLPDCKITNIIITPGNHDLWCRDIMKTDTIKSVLDIALQVWEIIAKEICPTANIITHNFFNTLLPLTDNHYTVGWMLMTPNIDLKYIYNDENYTQNLIEFLKNEETNKEKLFPYMYQLWGETEAFEKMINPFHDIDLTFDELNQDLANYLYKRYDDIKQFHQGRIWMTTYRDLEMTYFVKTLLFWFYDVNNIIKQAKQLKKTDTLIINWHFPFKFPNLEGVEWVIFEKQYLFPSKWPTEIDNFFNINLEWFFWLVKQIHVDNIIFLCGHTHEKYKGEIKIEWKTIKFVNNNLWYWY